ncbi:MAG: hypothetical protein R2831_04955 [Chitinophagaceae bacterium]
MQEKNLQTIEDIHQMMSKSSRFISLSGLSGIAAGLCALVGAYVANISIDKYYKHYTSLASTPSTLRNQLLFIAFVVLISAICTAFLFTYRKSKIDGIPIWGTSSMRLAWNTILPMLVGAIIILKCIQLNLFDFIAPICLLAYGLGLINGSKYTLGEIRYLGYLQLILGCINLWLPKHGLMFWALGFGALHIVYGVVMWFKYEREQKDIEN